jgi:hypothetical protein
MQPSAASQPSSVQLFPSSQSIRVPGLQASALQASPVVHASPSSQAMVFGVFTQPIAGSHPSSVQALLSSQSSGVPARQSPPPQLSWSVQAFASSHGAPVCFGV